MNILYFIGNGFDIGVGLNTQFMKVLPLYVAEKSDDIILKYFKENINQNINSWAAFEERMGLYTNEIKKKETPIETFIDYMNCVLDFKKFLNSYLKNEEKRVNYSDTQRIAELFNKSILNFTRCLNRDPKLILDEMEKEAINFSYINFNYTSVFDQCLNIFKESNIFPQEKRVKSGFFNMTKRNDLGNVIHIHGTLESDMILGVNDLRQIANIDFHTLEKISRYIKPDANNALENHKNTDVMRLLKEANIYCIFGMSLGNTDKKWWFEICKQLINNPEKHLIIYAYSENHDASFLENTLEEKDLCKNTFLKHLQFSELNKENLIKEIQKNIHIVINENIFKICLV